MDEWDEPEIGLGVAFSEPFELKNEKPDRDGFSKCARDHLFSHAARTSCLVMHRVLIRDIGFLPVGVARFNTISGFAD